MESICIEIIKKCHLKCKHCSAMSNYYANEEIKFEDFKKLLDNIQLTPGSIIFLSGGEPFLHKDLDLFIKEITQRKFNAFLYSSGTLLKSNKLYSIEKKEIEYLVKCGLIGVSFSIYSLGAFHDYVTNTKGSLETLIQTIKNICDVKGLKKELSFLPLKSNYQEINNIVEFANKWNINKINILKFICQGRAKYGFFQQESLNKEEEKEFVHILQGILNKVKVDIEVSKLYDCDNYSGLLKSPFSAGINEKFITSDLNILKGRRFRDHANN